MAENMNENTYSENMGDEMQGGADGSKKTFTQEEVNSFIQSRLSRMKAQAAKENEVAFSEREKALHDREMKLLVREQLSARGMSLDLAEVITCTNEEDLKTKLDILQTYSGNQSKSGFYHIDKNGDKIAGSESKYMKHIKQKPEVDPIRAAMGIKR